MFALFYSKRN